MTSRFDRQERIDGWDQSLMDKTVAVVGLGALGSNIVLGLIGLGVKNIIAFDFDIIELHNLNRQVLFTETDVGRFKSEAMMDRVNERNSEIAFVAIKEKVTEDNVEWLVEDADIIIGALDNIHGRLVISDFVITNDKVGIHVGTSAFGGEICTYSRKTPCLRCFLTEPENEEANRCTMDPEPAIVDTNMVIGSLAVGQVRNALIPLEGHQPIEPILYYNAMRTKKVFISRGKDPVTVHRSEPFWYENVTRKPNCMCNEHKD